MNYFNTQKKNIFYFLVIVSIFSSGWVMLKALEEAKDDAQLINALGRQRMLSQQMAKSILGYALAKSSFESIQVRIDTLNSYITNMRKVYTEVMLSASDKGDVTLSRQPNLDPHASFPYPATFTRLVNEEFKDSTGFSLDIISEYPINSDKKLRSKQDRDAYTVIKNNPKKIFSSFVEKSGGLDLLFYTGDIATTKQCLPCHSLGEVEERKVGDILGVRKFVVHFSDNFSLGKKELDPSLEDYAASLSLFKRTISAVKSGGSYLANIKTNRDRFIDPVSDRDAQKKIVEIEQVLNLFMESVRDLISANVNSEGYRNSRNEILGLSNQIRDLSDDLVVIVQNIANNNQQQVYLSAIFMGLVILLTTMMSAFFLRNSNTLEKLVEERTKELQKLTRAVTHSPVSIVITDDLGTIEYVNPKFCQVTGYTSEEAVGQNPKILKSENTPPEIYQGMWNTISRGQEWRGELQNRRKNGEHYWEMASISAVKNEQEKITHFVAIKEDITEHKQATQALAIEQERNQLILNSAGEGIFGLDAEGRVTFSNQAAARMLGYETKELLGVSMHKTVHHSYKDGSNYPAEFCPMRAAFIVGEVHQINNEVLWHKDGDCFPVEYTATPIHQEDSLVGAVVVFRDITEQKRLSSSKRTCRGGHQSQIRFLSQYEP
jgi:PAS domain S-box-containing protein